jgi:glycosyltransferase involved in cell wall biosynthesis
MPGEDGTASRGGAQVLQVTARYFPDGGGIETHVSEVCRRLVTRGVSVAVLTTDRSRELPTELHDDGFLVQRVRAWPRHRDYYLAPAIWGRVRRGPEEVIHCQGVHTLVPVVAMAAALSVRKPFVVTFHTGGHSHGHRNAMRGLQFRLLAPLLRRAEALIGVSRFERDLFQAVVRAPDDRMHVIRNGGSLPPADATALWETGTVVLSVGRLERYKGHHRLIEALPHLLGTHPDARVVVLGTGPYEEDLRSLVVALGVEDRVEITSVAGDDRVAMATRMAAASVVVMLSDYEAHPVSVMEALTLGRPVLVLRTSGLTELADDGLVVGIEESADAAAVASALRAMLDSPPVASRPRPALPTWETCADALVEVYRGIGLRVPEDEATSTEP